MLNLGYHGESLHFNSKLVITIKSHGRTITQPTENEMMNTNRNGIIIIRNPYKAIYGYIHTSIGGYLGYADVSKFVGDGMKRNNC